MKIACDTEHHSDRAAGALLAWSAQVSISSATARNEESMHRSIQLSWIGSWRAYAVRIERGRVIGLVRCRVPHLPFKRDAEFLHT